MSIDRRTLLQAALSSPLVLGAGKISAEQVGPVVGESDYRRIAVEEAFMTPELMKAQRKFLDENHADEPGFNQFWGTLMDEISVWDMFKEMINAPGSMGMRRAMDLGDGRIEAMDEAGIAMQLLSVTSPGVQIYDAALGSDLAQSINDRLGEAVRSHPDRFAGLATIAPQDPAGAVRELDRAVRQLGMKGALINSHTKGEFLDEEKFWPILEKAQELDVPIYIHPRTPAPQMVEPFQKYFGLDAAAFGFPMDASLHALRLILGGVFDEFPRLNVVLGHMGEGLPFWLPRIDKKIALFQGYTRQSASYRRSPASTFSTTSTSPPAE